MFVLLEALRLRSILIAPKSLHVFPTFRGAFDSIFEFANMGIDVVFEVCCFDIITEVAKGIVEVEEVRVVDGEEKALKNASSEILTCLPLFVIDLAPSGSVLKLEKSPKSALSGRLAAPLTIRDPEGEEDTGAGKVAWKLAKRSVEEAGGFECCLSISAKKSTFSAPWARFSIDGGRGSLEGFTKPCLFAGSSRSIRGTDAGREDRFSDVASFEEGLLDLAVVEGGGKGACRNELNPSPSSSASSKFESGKQKVSSDTLWGSSS